MSNNWPSGERVATDSVSNALRTLVLLRDRGSVRVTDVSNYLGVARSTAHRVLSTLRLHGFVDQEATTREYRYGPVLRSLTRQPASDQDVARAAHPHLRRLSAEVNETTNLLVLDGPDVLFIDGVEGGHPLRVAPRTGDRVSAYAAAAGKVLLAELTTQQLRARYPHGPDPLTAATLPTMEALLTDLGKARASGHGLNLAESVSGVHAVGVAIRDEGGAALAAVTISGPSSRLTRGTIKQLVPPLRTTATRISTALGYRAPS